MRWSKNHCSPALLFWFGVAVIGFSASLSLSYYISDFHNFWGQILAEAHGMIFDIAVIGILLFWLKSNGATRQQIRTYKDEIDDFRLWESEEAAFRTVGNIKRLNRHKIYENQSCELPFAFARISVMST